MSKNSIEIRMARSSDAEPLVGLDSIAQHSTDRQGFIKKAIGGENCFVAIFDNRPV